MRALWPRRSGALRRCWLAAMRMCVGVCSCICQRISLDTHVYAEIFNKKKGKQTTPPSHLPIGGVMWMKNITHMHQRFSTVTTIGTRIESTEKKSLRLVVGAHLADTFASLRPPRYVHQHRHTRALKHRHTNAHAQTRTYPKSANNGAERKKLRMIGGRQRTICYGICRHRHKWRGTRVLQQTE